MNARYRSRTEEVMDQQPGSGQVGHTPPFETSRRVRLMTAPAVPSRRSWRLDADRVGDHVLGVRMRSSNGSSSGVLPSAKVRSPHGTIQARSSDLRQRSAYRSTSRGNPRRRRGSRARRWRPPRRWWPSRRRAVPRTTPAAPRSADPRPGRAKSPPEQLTACANRRSRLTMRYR